MTEDIKDKLAALAIIMLARRHGAAAKLTDGCRLQGDEDDGDFVRFVREQLPLNTEYGAQMIVPRRILDELTAGVTVVEDLSMRAWEVNAIMERPTRR